MVDPDPVAVDTKIRVTATLDDTNTGNSNIASDGHSFGIIAATGPQRLAWEGPSPKAFEFFLQPGSSWKGGITGIKDGPIYSLLIE
jgi:hypothetical protein